MTNKFYFTIFIICSAIIIAGAIIFIDQKDTILPPEKPEEQDKNLIEIRPVSAEDNILGNPKAPVIFVEYSDFECGYCKQFHTTMQRIMDEYGKQGKVAWVYRHFPIQNSHPNAYQSSIASLCVNKLGGNDLFWQYINLVFDKAPVSLSQTNLKEIANSFGVNPESYEQCLKEDEIKNRLEADIQDGMKLFENDPSFGTPYIIIIANGELIPVVGSQPYSVLKEIIDKYLSTN